MWPFFPFCLSFLIDAHFAYAARVPFQVRYAQPNDLSKRGVNSSVPITNTYNAEYISTITLGGSSFPVLLDTGSSDLWVAGSVSQTTSLGKSETLSYAIGKAGGEIQAATLDFAGYTVNNQAYVQVLDTSTFSFNIQAQGFSGLIGLGPNSGSKIYDDLSGSTGYSVLNRIFTENNVSSPSITFYLDRANGTAISNNGMLTIDEVLPQYSNITSYTKLSVDKVHRLTDADQHWQVFTDANGIIGPDGNTITLKSIAPSAPKGQLVAVIDTGFTLTQVPRYVSDAIYGCVPGAVFDSKNQFWTVPCDSLINVSFEFGGVQIPIHPLDTVMSEFNYKDANGNTACVGSFQPITSAFSLLGEYDMVLGMSFLRNVYTYIDFGNFVKGGSFSYNPFVYLMPVTNQAQAHADFVTARMGGVDVSGNAAHALLPTDQCQQSPIPESEKKKELQAKILSRWPYIFLGCFIFVLLLVGFGVWKCCKRRRQRREKKLAAELGLEGKHQRDQTYLELQDSNGYGNSQTKLNYYPSH
ncbi:acid protease [Thelephora terrestris]|uniref:Acid protease n=1 Tax=Thelephora terrestris TaxID=56493 RepID=A0A9P6L5J8_9AGAM|nr:acid protease [Thelephora terrestris]